MVTSENPVYSNTFFTLVIPVPWSGEYTIFALRLAAIDSLAIAAM